DNEAAGFLAPGLPVDQFDMSAVYFWNDKRHVLLHAESARVCDHGAARVGEAGFQFSSDGRVKSGENYFGRAFRSGWRDGHGGDRGRNWRFEAPARGFGVVLALGTVGSGQPCHFEPRVVLQHLNKSLTDDTGGAENADRNFSVHRLPGIL